MKEKMPRYKITLFLTISFTLSLFFIELSARSIYFVTKGQISHLMPDKIARNYIHFLKYNEKIDKIEEQKWKDNKMFEVKNGYYIFNKNLNNIPSEFDRSNNIGFRGEKDIGIKTKPRILCFGGSSTFGYQQKTSWPEKLGELLSGYEVINCGVHGSTVENIYNLMRDDRFFNSLSPDIIIINAFWNTMERYENRVLCNTIDNKAFNFLLKHSVLAFLVYKGILSIRYGETIGPFQVLSFYTDKICKLATTKGIKVILMTEPMLLDNNTWTAAPQYPKTHSHGDKVLKSFSDKYKNVYFISVKFFDRTDFTKEEANKYALDRGHLTELGYSIVAHEIYTQFVNLEHSITSYREGE